MVQPEETVLVGLSGGPDSCALLDALCRLRRRLRCRVAAAHVHHGLRGKEADADAEHAAALADSLGVPFHLCRVDVRAHARAGKLSLEAAARELRYRELTEVAAESGADRIATGHTADDQAETVLLNLLRGAGGDGLAGIWPVRGNIIRPFLGVTHAEVLDYCRACRIAHRVDSSNADVRFARNRIRHEVLPLLRAIQPEVVSALCRTAALLRDDREVLEPLSGSIFERLSDHAPDGVSLHLADLDALPLGLRRRVIRAALARVRGDLDGVDMERVEAIARLAAEGRAGTRVEVPGGLTVRRSYDVLVFSRGKRMRARLSSQRTLPVPGRLDLPELGIRLTARRSRSLKVRDDRAQAALDEEKLYLPLLVRTRRPGDRFVPLGMRQEKKLQDFFVDERVPREERSRTPLVLSGDEIVWVVGHRISDRYKVTGRTRRTVRLKVTPLDSTSEKRHARTQ